MNNIDIWLQKAKKNNTVNLSEILDLNLNEEEYKKLLKALKSNDIEIVIEKSANSNDFFLDEERYPRKEEDEDIEKMYIKEAKKYSVLTKEEERELLSKIKSGDKNALSMFVNHNQRLVIYVVEQTNKSKRLEFLDAVQEGNLGLLKAIEKFDLSTDYKFSTYGTWWIKQFIKRAINKKSRLITISAQKENLIKNIRRFESNYLMEHERFPTTIEIAFEFSISPKIVLILKSLETEFLSLESPVNDENDTMVKDNIADLENFQENVDNKMYIENIYKYAEEKFNPKEKYIFEKRIIEEQTLEDVGNALGITIERVRQIEKKVKSKLRNYKIIVESNVESPKIFKKSNTNRNVK